MLPNLPIFLTHCKIAKLGNTAETFLILTLRNEFPLYSRAGKQTVLEYAANATIGGISYIFDGALLILERLLWLVVFVVLVILAVYWSLEAYQQWKESPVLTSVKTTGKQIFFAYT